MKRKCEFFKAEDFMGIGGTQCHGIAEKANELIAARGRLYYSWGEQNKLFGEELYTYHAETQANATHSGFFLDSAPISDAHEAKELLKELLCNFDESKKDSWILRARKLLGK